MGWIVLAIVSYFLNAVVAVVDKFLLHQKVRDPLVYSFYVAALNSAAFVFWPFDFSFLSFGTTLLALIAGASFFGAIFFFYSAFIKGEISRVVPVVGAVSPIVVFILSYVFLNERMPIFWFFSFVILVLGAVLFLFEKNGNFLSFKVFVSAPFYSFLAALFFAVSFFTTKAVFLKASFINGFVWTRVGTVGFVLVLYLLPFFRKTVHQSKFNIKKRLFLFFLSNKVLGASAFVILNYAIALGSVSIVNALQGVQYVFLFFLTIILSVFFPRILQESLKIKTILQKSIGIILICLGITILFIA